jgi:hypothetical protein
MRRTRVASIAVGVLVTWAGGALTPLTASAGGGAPSVTVTMSKNPVRAGSTKSADVLVTDATQTPFAGATVSVLRDFDGTNCANAPSAQTDATGHATMTVTVRCRESLTFQAELPDTTVVSSEPVEVDALLPMSMTVPIAKRPYWAVHIKKSLHPGVGDVDTYAPMLIQLRRGGGTWHNVSTGPLVWLGTAGAHRVRLAYPGDALTDGFAPSTSPGTTFRVRKGHVPHWLKQLNHYRRLAHLGVVGEDQHKDKADRAHIRYMQRTGQFGHYEDTSSPYYSNLGEDGGTHSDIFFGEAKTKVIPGWLEAPYHAKPILEQSTYTAGFAYSAPYAALYVYDSQARVEPDVYPETWPAANGHMPLHIFPGNESPDPVPNCPSKWGNRLSHGHALGAALIARTDRPRLRDLRAKLWNNGHRTPVCIFHDVYDFGSTALLPLYPLKSHHHYHVRVVTREITIAWSFRT